MPSYFLGKTDGEAIWKGYHHGRGSKASAANDATLTPGSHQVIFGNISVPPTLIGKQCGIWAAVSIWNPQLNNPLFCHMWVRTTGGWGSNVGTYCTAQWDQVNLGWPGGDVRTANFCGLIWSRPTAATVDLAVRIEGSGSNNNYRLWNSFELQTVLTFIPVYNT